MVNASVSRHLPPDVGEIAAALATVSERTLVSHRTAAQLWGLWIPDFGGIEFTTPATDRGSRYTTSIQRRAVIAHRRIVRPGDVASLHDLPITTLARTWLDTVPQCSDIHDAVALGDSALRAGASIADLVDVIGSSRGVRGLRLARASVGLLDARSRSRPESRIRSAIILGGLPWPAVNEAIHDENGQWIAEPDLLYRRARVALEYNGAHHGQTGQMRKDSARLLDLQRAGWAVRTYTARHAFQGLDEVVADVRQLLLRRSPELLVHRQLRHRVTERHIERRRYRRHSA